MRRIPKMNVALIAMIAGVPVLLFFQNCGQAGSVSTASAALNANSTSDSMVIVPPTSADINLNKPPVDSDDNNFDHSKGSIGQCGDVVISDILLKISSISSNCDKPDQKSFEIIDSDKSISLDKLTLKVKALKSEKVREIMLILSSSGNKVLSADNIAMDLKAPSAQQSGLKVKLSEEFSVEAGQIYSLELSVNPSEQIVTNKNKCIFKPIVRDALLSAL